MYNVSIAKRCELPTVVRLSKEGIEQIDVEPAPIVDTNVLADTVYKNYMISPVFILQKNGVPVGVAPTTLNTYGWSKSPHLSTLVIYIQKDHKSLNTLDLLMKAITEYANKQGIPYIDTFMGQKRIRARKRLIKRQGFKEAGTTFIYGEA